VGKGTEVEEGQQEPKGQLVTKDLQDQKVFLDLRDHRDLRVNPVVKALEDSLEHLENL
jgi:hypothetical protein